MIRRYKVQDIKRKRGEFDGKKMLDYLLLRVNIENEDCLIELPIDRLREYVPSDPEVVNELRAIRETLSGKK